MVSLQFEWEHTRYRDLRSSDVKGMLQLTAKIRATRYRQITMVRNVDTGSSLLYGRREFVRVQTLSRRYELRVATAI